MTGEAVSAAIDRLMLRTWKLVEHRTLRRLQRRWPEEWRWSGASQPTHLREEQFLRDAHYKLLVNDWGSSSPMTPRAGDATQVAKDGQLGSLSDSQPRSRYAEEDFRYDP